MSPNCEYTKTDLGQADARCDGCKWRVQRMKYEDIKNFEQRCEQHQDHQSGMITTQMLEDRLQEEVDELRAYIEKELKGKK
jgi:hypothetical protein